MKCTFQNFRNLKIDGTSISLESPEHMYPYWCYPLHCVPIGLEGCILYCFIEGYDEVVFASNPETCADTNVYPLARNFEDFIKLILACGSANPVEQIVWMSESQFHEHLKEEHSRQTIEQQNVLNRISEEFSLAPMEHPYTYVKKLQAELDCSKIEYRDEYYDILGIEKN